jgi:hypothetical protein
VAALESLCYRRFIATFFAASGITAFNYQYPQDKTCSKASTVVFQRPLTCAPILFDGSPVSDFQIFTCV